MSTFRLATLNIHSFCKPSNYDSNISDLVSILRPLNLDLIAVQELQPNDKLKIFSTSLSLSYSVYGECDEDYFLNGIASRYPIKSHSTEETTFICSGGSRSLLQCQLDGDHPFIKDRIFAVTHLDHLDEDNRLKQINQFNPYEHNVDILMGDMNALTRADYSDEYYQEEVVRARQRSFWEAPRFNLTKLITNEWNYQDAFRMKNPEMKDKQVATCRFGTRIDYIYVRPRIDDDWILNECSVIDTEGATDHNAVFAEFIKIPE